MDIEKLYRVIDSCETLGQLNTAKVYISIARRFYMLKMYNRPWMVSIYRDAISGLLEKIDDVEERLILRTLSDDYSAISQKMAFNYWGKAGELS